MKLTFNIHFQTRFGEHIEMIFIDEKGKHYHYPLNYIENGNWQTEIDFFSRDLSYVYRLTDDDGNVKNEELCPHKLHLSHNYQEYQIFDVWNLRNYPENYLNNKILKVKWQESRLKKESVLKKHTHLFRIEIPLYQKNWRVVIIGNCDPLGNWDVSKAVPMEQTEPGIWEKAITIAEPQYIQYKYALQNVKDGTVFDIETGDNRWAIPNREKHGLHIKADHYFGFKNYQMYHSAGVAIPVFSIRTQKGFGIGEFSDLPKLAKWAEQCGISMIQVLPVNDTTTDFSWKDSYPYAAVSAHALHPIYLSIDDLPYSLSETDLENYETDKKVLNELSELDYETVLIKKWKYIKKIYDENRKEILKDRSFQSYLRKNKNWLLPYAAFCVQRNRYKTADFRTWKTHKRFIEGRIASFLSPENKDYKQAMLHCWVQYQLHLQFRKAVEKIHKIGVVLKGDLPVGVHRNSVEAWSQPQLFCFDFQTGAPPDQFTEIGQNWEFPTYNWDVMRKDGFQWWKNRFKALEDYFDALRIDHILGFFRIWRIPVSAVQAILGYFHPASAITKREFSERGISFDDERYCKPYITDSVLKYQFGEASEEVVFQFLNQNSDGTYAFKTEFDTQRKVSDYFKTQPDSKFLEELLYLLTNVMFIEEEMESEKVYHPRFNLHKTESFQALSAFEKKYVYDLYTDYFYRRQEEEWKKNAMSILPVFLESTEMLICGEDLGVVPDVVPEVMEELGIVALKIQRMPKEEHLSYYNPETVSYLNVVSASSHDTSTLRQWWLEDRELSVQYFHEQLQQSGTPPWNLEPELAEIVLKQHLYNEAMLCIFPLQDILACDRDLARTDINSERINEPAEFPHYWKYRMHLEVEQLQNETGFSGKLKEWITESGRL